MTTFDVEHVAELALALIGATAFVILFAARVRLSHEYVAAARPRLMLVDLLLVIVGIELVADALHGLGLQPPFDGIATVIAFASRGALVAGAIALAASVDWVER